MSEGLSGTEAGKEIAEHAKHSSGHRAPGRRDRIVSIAEAALLSLVTLAAAWSGYAAAKWDGESSVRLAVALEARTDASRADLDAREDRNFDLSTFEAWFDAYVAGDEHAMALAMRRFRPEFAAAFDAWRTTNPETNPAAPRGPTFMPQYRQPGLAEAKSAGGEGGRGVRRGRVRRPDRRQVRPGHRVPGQRAVPGGHQHALPGPGGAVRAHRARRCGARCLPCAARSAAPSARVTEGR